MPMSLPSSLVDDARREREESALSSITSDIDGLIRGGMGGLETLAKGAAEQVAPFSALLSGGDITVPTLEDLTPDFLKQQYAPKPPQPIMGAMPQTTPQPGTAAVQPAGGRPAAMPTGGASEGDSSGVADVTPDAPVTRETVAQSAAAALAKAGLPTEMARYLAGIAINEGILQPGTIARDHWSVGGVKAPGSGGVVTVPTREVINGQSVMQTASFGKFGSMQEGMDALAAFVRDSPRFGPVVQRAVQSGDYSSLIAGFKEQGYATDPNWVRQVDSIANGLPAPAARPVGPQPTTPGPAEQTPAAQAQAGQGIDIGDVAQRYAGGKYVYGGGRDGQGGIAGALDSDCSSFVSGVWREKGLPLVAHTDGAYNQLRQMGAPEVGVRDAQAGDVVFYMGAGSGGAITHHMGIYAGDGKVLDQSTGGGGGVKTRDVGHAGKFVIIRDPRLNAEQARTANVPPPIVPTGIAEQTGGERLSRAEMSKLSLNTGTGASPSAPASDTSAGAAASSSAAPATTPRSPWDEIVGGGPLMMKDVGDEYDSRDADSGPRESGYTPAPFSGPGDGGTAPTAYEQPYSADEGPRESRPAPIPPTDPTITDPNYTTVPTVDPLNPATWGPSALPGGQSQPRASFGGQSRLDDPRLEQGVIAQGIDAVGQMLPDRPIVDTRPEDTRTFMGNQPASVGQLWEWRGRLAEGTADALTRGIGQDPDTKVLDVEIGGVPIRMTVSELLENLTDPLLGIGYGVGDMVLDAAGKAVMRLVAPYAKGAARETIGRLINSEPVQNVARRAGEIASDIGTRAGEAAQATGRYVAGELMDIAPTPRMIQESGGGSRQVQPTVEVLQEQLDWMRSTIDRARQSGDAALEKRAIDRAWELESALVDARNARTGLEPAISSDVGRRIERLPLDERTADDLAMQGRERVSAADAADLGGPASVVPDRFGRANAAPPFSGPGAGVGSQIAADVGASIQGAGAGAAYSVATGDEENLGRNVALGAAGMPLAGRAVGRGLRNAGPGLRTGVVPPHVADQMADTFPVRIPTDPKALAAIRAIGGTIDPERGVTFHVTRAQHPKAGGSTAHRGGVFYEPVRPDGGSSYVNEDDVLEGGSQAVRPSPTRFRSLYVRDQHSSGSIDTALQGLGLPVTAQQLATEVSEAGGDIRAIQAIVAKYDGDPSLVGEMAKRVHPDLWHDAIRENILSGRARLAGHDGILTVSPGVNADLPQLIEVQDIREAANPTVGRISKKDKDAAYEAWMMAVRENASAAADHQKPVRLGGGSPETYARFEESGRQELAARGALTSVRPPAKGFSVRSDIPRPPGANWAGVPFDPTGAAAGGAAGAMSEDEDGEAGDPLRTAAGIGLGAFGARVARIKPKIGATAAQVAEETAAGARRGAALNNPLERRISSVPRAVQAATKLTDDRAAQRWAEDMLTDAAGSPRLAEMDPARPSTQSRINAGGIANARLDEELAPAVEKAAEAGLQRELPQYLEAVHQKDLMDDAYADAAEDVMAEWAPRIDNARRAGAAPATIARMEARAEAVADKAGNQAIKKVQAPGSDGRYEAVDARIQAVEARVAAEGKEDALREASQGVWDHNRATVERLRDAGIVSKEEADAILTKYPHGVPTTVVERLTNAETLRNVPLTEAFTSTGRTMNPIVASRIFTLQAERAIQRNGVMTAFGRLFDDAVDAGGIQPGPSGARSLWGGGKTVTWMQDGKPVTINVPAPVADGLEASANMGVNGNMVIDGWKRVAGFITSSITAGRASFLPVNFVRDLQDFTIRNAVNEGGPQKIPAIVGTFMDEAGKAFADLAASNFNLRGVTGAGVGAATGVVQGDEDTTLGERATNAVKGGVAGLFLGGANKTRITGNAADFLARGGGSGAINPGVRSSERWYREVIRDGGAVVRTPKDVANYLGDWMKDIASLQGVKAINERTELIARTATMRRSTARGLSETEAVVAGRDATYDPDRAGVVTRAVNGLVPFLNATVQSGAQFKRLFNQHPGFAAVTMATTVAPVMLAMEAWNRSDPERAQKYDDVPQYVKDSGLVLVLPGTSSDARGERPNYVVIPTGLATPAIVAMRSALKNVPGLEPSAGRVKSDPDANIVQQAADALSAAIQVFSPVKGDGASAIASSMVPPGVKQLVELGLNKDLYRGAPVVSDSADERASAFSRTAAQGANAAGRAVGSDFLQEVKPSGVEYAVRQAPAYGDIITGASDMVAPGPAKLAEDRPIANQPFFGGVASRFVKDTGGANLTRAQDERLPDGARSVLEDAGLPPSTITPVPTRYKGATLTRDEQEAWQSATNSLVEREVARASRSPEWRARGADHEKLVKEAVTRARDAAAERALRRLTDGEVERRLRREKAS